MSVGPLASNGRILIISGPSGSGKTTLQQRLLESEKLKERLVKSISATTRPRRENEEHGRDYIFLTTKSFLNKKNAGHFLESQKVFRYYYGTPEKNVRQLLKRGKNVLLCIDVKGAKVVEKKYPDVLKVFIKAPSLQVLKKRLLARGTEDKEDLNLRLDIAREELKLSKKYHFVIVNDNLQKAFAKLEKVVCQHL